MGHLRPSRLGLVVLLALAACHGGNDSVEPDPPDDTAAPGDPAALETATYVEGEATYTTEVWVGSDGARHYRTVGIERGQVVVVAEAVRAAGSPMLPLRARLTLEDRPEPFEQDMDLDLPLESEDLERLTGGIAYVRRMTVNALRAEATGVIEQDKPGCDAIPQFVQGSCSDGGACCDAHDKCYADNGCTSSSWGGSEGATCVGCNTAVTACIVGGNYGAFLGLAFFGPWGGVVGMIASWIFSHVVGESDCCRVPGPGVGSVCQSDSCDVGWYGWGNHACHVGPDTFVNIYCMAQPYTLPNGAGPYYFWQGCYKYDARNNTTYRLPDDQVWCDPQNENGYCNDRFDCVACPAGLKSECNPPIFTPGSLMDQICVQGIPAGTPDSSPPPWVPTCTESGGNTCDNDLSDGSACGPEYNLLTAYDCVHCCNKDAPPPPPPPPACEWYDCQGTCNGGAVADACGVCGGDGSSCAPPPPPPQPTCDWYDCQGTCNGGAVDDACGVCGGDGSSCAPPPPPPPPACDWYDCQGTCNGSVGTDVCGICGGDGSTCAPPPACDWYDCQGTCNGSVGTDVCGICGGDGSSCAPPPTCDWYDCQGTCNGSVGIDACGVCGGDGSSCAPPPCSWYDCQGTCDGGVWNDSCGVCGGDGTSCACAYYDCMGICNGPYSYDWCGTCGGDGSTCYP